jgi:hypothetical protein
MIPPGVNASGTSLANGFVPPPITIQNRFYSCSIGSFIDVNDFDAQILRSNGWVALGLVGTTTQRTSSTWIGQAGMNQYVDTTLGYTLFWDGTTWRDTTGTSR